MRNSEAGRALYLAMTQGSDHWPDQPEHQRKIWAAKEDQVVKAAVGEDLNACQLAIAHVLRRIKTEKDVGFHLGVGTQAFKLLTEAFARLTGEPVADVRDRIIPGSGDIPH
jgi:hypothetical protein